MLANSAAWRDRKAEEYPDDNRNSEAANRLRELAVLLGRAPDDHETPVAVARFRNLKGMQCSEVRSEFIRATEFERISA